MAPRQKTSRKEPQPDDPDTKRTTIRVLCGWCATGDHEDCKRELLWYERHYVCACNCADAFYANLTGAGDESTVVPVSESSPDS